ncbi:lipoate--protein ligase family protein [Paenibacillus eucommiae]|uniref:Octanoyl-[GcvH]:protein N-octanoyltransferase n=1 Tax=Paenibacillus eucommiae TaxID=1355755 RepID=A0ABS4J7A1_9BACL|nr:lipoate--protein ligase family protein [Paenibacillus eucommiae]MBP1995685.1 octanoyl-[GcvH]:protein N-octanoyltransferase [Paenibacillus eucommiae]
MNANLLPANMVLLDRTSISHPYDILYPFALEELLCRKIGKGGQPVAHFWRHPKAFVIGLRDSRLPHAGEANSWLHANGYKTAVRNSGGAAVPLDLGVVNISLLLPRPDGNIDYHKDFELMVTLIQEALLKLTSEVHKGEVAGSFCPGDYDLSIGGRKFCGIAQRRQQNALSVQAFVIVEGAGADKADLAKAFYDRAALGGDPADYPEVLQDRMASLSECLGQTLKAEDFIHSVREILAGQGVLADLDETAMPEEDEIQAMIEQLRNRYKIDS